MAAGPLWRRVHRQRESVGLEMYGRIVKGSEEGARLGAWCGGVTMGIFVMAVRRERERERET